MISTSNSAIRLPVRDPSQVGEARRFAAVAAREHGLPPAEASKASLLATEAANNLVKHTGGGELILHCLEEAGVTGIEIAAFDKGPGMADLDRCMEDGYSTAGSPGTGLGAMARLSSFFEIYSRPQQGTCILMRLWGSGARKESERHFQVGGFSVPFPGETICGDGWVAEEENGRLTVMVSDGLGHGRLAADSSSEAVRVFRESPQDTPAQRLEAAHGALRKTRGAAIAVARIDLHAQTIHFAGIGNIAGMVLSGGSTRSMISYNGIVGHQMHKVQELSYPWPRDGLLIMHSDGIQSRWSLDAFPGLERHHPSLVAGTIYRDFKRPRDDVTVVAARVAT